MITIGKIRENYGDENLPSIRDLISAFPIREKEKILSYLKKGKIIAVAAGKATDLISGETIEDELCCYSDGEYVWRSDIIYYFEKYNMKLPDDFIGYVLENS